MQRQACVVLFLFSIQLLYCAEPKPAEQRNPAHKRLLSAVTDDTKLVASVIELVHARLLNPPEDAFERDCKRARVAEGAESLAAVSAGKEEEQEGGDEPMPHGATTALSERERSAWNVLGFNFLERVRKNPSSNEPFLGAFLGRVDMTDSGDDAVSKDSLVPTPQGFRSYYKFGARGSSCRPSSQLSFTFTGLVKKILIRNPDIESRGKIRVTKLPGNRLRYISVDRYHENFSSNPKFINLNTLFAVIEWLNTCKSMTICPDNLDGSTGEPITAPPHLIAKLVEHLSLHLWCSSKTGLTRQELVVFACLPREAQEALKNAILEKRECHGASLISSRAAEDDKGSQESGAASAAAAAAQDSD